MVLSSSVVISSSASRLDPVMSDERTLRHEVHTWGDTPTRDFTSPDE